ncbi:MAG: type II toxin-antitoxin system VapC family toxin [Micrococcales bacterium]|nr:type II toxin-antitoxin system VapC family toxin [Micrococcales bacterium]
MRYYLDSSVALHAVLPKGDAQAVGWVRQAVETRDQVFSSVLLRLEMIRTLRREGLTLSLAEPLLARLSLTRLTDPIVKAAEMIERHVRALDALHLATLIQVDPTATLVSHDARMAGVAGHLGIPVFDPMADRRLEG